MKPKQLIPKIDQNQENIEHLKNCINDLREKLNSLCEYVKKKDELKDEDFLKVDVKVDIKDEVKICKNNEVVGVPKNSLSANVVSRVAARPRVRRAKAVKKNLTIVRRNKAKAPLRLKKKSQAKVNQRTFRKFVKKQ